MIQSIGGAAAFARLPEILLQWRSARALQARAVAPEGGPAVDAHPIGQDAVELPAHGGFDGPPDGQGQALHRFVEADEVLAGSLSLGAMDRDVEGPRGDEPLGIGRGGTPGHHGPNQDQGLQRPSEVVATPGGACGLSRWFPDLGGENLADRAGERLGPLGLTSRPLGRRSR